MIPEWHYFQSIPRSFPVLNDFVLHSFLSKSNPLPSPPNYQEQSQTFAIEDNGYWSIEKHSLKALKSWGLYGPLDLEASINLPSYLSTLATYTPWILLPMDTVTPMLPFSPVPSLHDTIFPHFYLPSLHYHIYHISLEWLYWFQNASIITCQKETW